MIFLGDTPDNFLNGPYGAGLANFFSIYSGAAALIGGLTVYAQTSRKRKHLVTLLEIEEKSNRALKLELSEAREEKDAAIGRLPETARDLAEKEISEGNLDLAQRALAGWMGRESETISQMLFMRAEWALGYALGELRAQGLAAAHGYANASQAFRPNFPEAFLLRREIEVLLKLEDNPATATPALADFDREAGEMIERLSLDDRGRFTQMLFEEFEHRMRVGQYHSANLILRVAEGWIPSHDGVRSTAAIVLKIRQSRCARELGRHKEGLAYAENALALCNAHPALDPTGNLRGVALLFHANELYHLGRYDVALAEAKEVVGPQSRAPNLGPEDRGTLAGRSLVAEILARLGRNNEALAEAKAVFDAESRDPSLGPENPQTLISRYLVAAILAGLGRSNEALVEAKAVFDAESRNPNLGPEHPQTLVGRFLIAEILEQLGRFDEALAEAKAVFDAQSRDPNLGPEHPQALNSRYLVAKILEQLGRHNEALAEAKAEFDARSRDPEHPDTQRTVELIREIECSMMKSPGQAAPAVPAQHKSKGSDDL
jgi:tetratricopeptide (TPR) repeat protein